METTPMQHAIILILRLRATPIKLYGAMMKEEIASYKFNYCMRGLKKYGSLILTIF